MEKNLRLGKLWDEWLNTETISKNQSDFEAAGLLMGMKNSGFAFQTNRLRTARRLMKLWPGTSYYDRFGFTPAISLITQKNHKPKVKISCPPKILRLPKNLRGVWSWLKGIFGSAGGFYFPKNGYHISIIISDEKIHSLASKFLVMTGLAWSERRHEFSLRNHDDIMTFLCSTGMTVSALEFDKTAMIRSVKNRVNVTRNYEAANIARTVRASREQIELAKKFLSLPTPSLPPKLREVAELRINNPDDSLEELGAKLNPPVKKSTVKYRWKKIQSYLDSQ
ncbi:MAG: DNA-binding protein WhiA [Synergistaceae bacterium]|nr:DNA-binding protein WhiA [Synergistaceae bacterium]